MSEPTTEAGRKLLVRMGRERWQVSALYNQPDMPAIVVGIEAEARQQVVQLCRALLPAALADEIEARCQELGK